MKMTTSWAFASAAVVAILVAGCTTDTTDTSEGGVSTTGTAGTSTGTAGAGGDNTAGSSGAGGTSSGTDAGGMMSACETCAYAKCNSMKEVDNCENDKGAMGCSTQVDAFYDCLKTANTEEKVAGCGTDFASMVSSTGMTQGFVNELAGCVTDTDPTKGCLAECGATAGGGDGGTE
jgi:hypothetical protein